MRTRREAREWALKILYAHDLSGNPIDLVIQQLLPKGEEEANAQFTLELVRKTLEKGAAIDEAIQRHAEKWDLSRIAVLDRLILRLAICEILYFDDIPPKVSINEAIEIAKKYSTEKSDKFVNGILDAVLHRQVLGEKQDRTPEEG
ncbi:MAG TPA: transcription antitermination factor NusB [bacterium]|jgi:N utilization substance protein B